jgi:membrane protease subunit HflK
MSWSNSGGGGPWKPGNPGPWGQGPGSSGGQTPPDLEEFIRRSQQRLKGIIPGGSIGGGLGILAVVLVAVLLWLASGFYTVSPNEVGLNLVFGKYGGTSAPGLNYNFPYPIGDVIKLAVTDRNSTDVGFVSGSARSGQVSSTDVLAESLMLTGDDNIADVKFRVIWQIDPEHPEYYAFNLRHPDETVKAVAESAMREVIGRQQIQYILTSGRKTIEPEVQTLIQNVLTQYKAGVLVLQVQLLSVDPPAQVIAAFRDVTAAQQDQQRLSNEAQGYANKVVPEARGAAAAIRQEAEGYKTQTVQEAAGQASRFDQVYDQYKNAPDVTRERIYLETMESILAGADKTIIDKTGAGVLPVLPLDGGKPLPVLGAKP